MSAIATGRSDPAAVVVRAMRSPDWPAVREIYVAGIATGNATFETQIPDWPDFDAAHLTEHRLVAADAASDAVLGWVAVSPVSRRSVYAGVVEASVYVAPHARGRAVGRQLLAALIASTEAGGVWTIQASVFPENSASCALHQAAGFRVVGRRERLARMTFGPWAGTWRDVLLLERRSRRKELG